MLNFWDFSLYIDERKNSRGLQNLFDYKTLFHLKLLNFLLW